MACLANLGGFSWFNIRRPMLLAALRLAAVAVRGGLVACHCNAHTVMMMWRAIWPCDFSS
jgi:hypothetical protein